MKFKKILIASLLLVILTAGVVCASDENATDDNLAVNEDIQVIEVDNQVGSFSNLSDEINEVEQDGTLVFKNDYKYDPAADDNNGILINKSMVIDGDGHYIDATDSFRVFDIQTDNLTLKNIVFKNLGSYATLTCDAYNCTFTGATLEVDTLFTGNLYNCTFIDCHSDMGTKIFKGTAYNTEFINCTGLGGADGVLDELVGCTLVNFKDPRQDNSMEIITSSGPNGPSVKFKSKYDGEGDISFRGKYTVIVKNMTQTSQEVNITVSRDVYDKASFDFGQSVPEFYTVDLGILEKGNYSVFVSFSGDQIYAPCNGSTVMVIDRNPGDPFDFTDLSKLIEEFIKNDSGGHEYDIQSVLYLNDDYTYNPETDEAIRDTGILINKTITIDGQGHTLNGNDDSHIFEVNANGVVFRDIIFTNGNAYVGGGAAINGNCSAVNCTFNSNHAEYGGAMRGGSAVNCIFNYNSASFGDPEYGGGGAMADGSAVNCTFYRNSAGTGGALYKCSAIGCIFNSNSAENNLNGDIGGAMYEGSAVNCTFNGNYASSGCGGAMAGGSAVNCRFNRNYAPSGGAIIDVSAVNCNFNNNKAYYGGAMARGSAENCYFKDNNVYSPDRTVDAMGGAIFDGTAVNCTFNSNYAQHYGGAMSGGSAVNCTFNSNYAQHCGGAMYQGSAMNCYFADNYAECGGDGGAMYDGTAVNCTFDDNYVETPPNGADGSGGAIYKGSALNCTFNRNHAVLYGGALANAFAENCIFNDNYVILTRDTGLWDGNSGGAMYNGDAVNCAFNRNHGAYGGALYQGSAVNCTFDSNNADYGGAMCIRGDSNITDCVFINNSVYNNLGNSIYVIESVCRISNPSFDKDFDNIASDDKSNVILIRKAPTLDSTDYTFDYNNVGTVSAFLKYGNIYLANNEIIFKFNKGDVLKNFTAMTNENGCAMLDGEIDNLDSGVWTVLIIFEGNDNYGSCNRTSSIKVNPISSSLIIEDINVTSGNEIRLVADVAGSDNVTVNEGTVTFLDGETNVGEVKVVNGVASLSIPKTYGKHVITAIFKSNNYLASNAKYSFIVGEVHDTTITASNITTVYNGGKYLVATLKDDLGNPLSGVNVSVKLSNGKTTILTTDKDGKVKKSTSGLAPKTYTATITFDGNAKYQKSDATVKVIVKKATPKLTAKTKSFKKSLKTKKYTVTLKTNKNKVMKNKKVTIKVNKKTYTAKTNKKGVATFKITKLTKKAKYIALVKFAGSKYYNSKSVKTVITVK